MHFTMPMDNKENLVVNRAEIEMYYSPGMGAQV